MYCTALLNEIDYFTIAVFPVPFPLQRSDDDSDGHDRPAAAAAAAGSGARMKELLASYYGMQQQQQRTGEDMSSDVESTYFDPKRYVSGLLRNDRIETLLRKDDEMVRVVESG